MAAKAWKGWKLKLWQRACCFHIRDMEFPYFLTFFSLRNDTIAELLWNYVGLMQKVFVRHLLHQQFCWLFFGGGLRFFLVCVFVVCFVLVFLDFWWGFFGVGGSLVGVIGGFFLFYFTSPETVEWCREFQLSEAAVGMVWLSQALSNWCCSLLGHWLSLSQCSNNPE